MNIQEPSALAVDTVSYLPVLLNVEPNGRGYLN